MAFLIDAKLFAENMRYYREKQDYTLADVARLSGLIVPVIAELEKGVHVPAGKQLECIAAALHVDQTSLVLPRPPEMDYYESC